MKHRARVSPAAIRKRREYTAALLEAGIDVRWRQDKPGGGEPEIRSAEAQGQAITDGLPGPCGKIAYTSRKAANKALNKLIRARALQLRAEDIECRVYGPCEKDGCRATGLEIWHLTSRKR